MRAWIGTMVVATTLGCIGSAHAAFVNFRNTPGDLGSSWVGMTSQGNQREIYLDLVTHTDSFLPLEDGIDGALYTGYLDPALKPFDQAFYGSFTPEVNNLVFGSHSTSPSGTTVVSMANLNRDVDSIDITLGNTLNESPFKELWIEWVSTCVTVDEDSVGDWLEIDAFWDLTIVDVHHQRLSEGSDWYVTNVLARIEPNPYLETFVFHVPELGGVSGSPKYYLDTIAIATNCVPEPSSAVVWLLLGAMSLLFGRRRA
ncbi:MAG TPA: hypothetical protein DD670_18290 [Planctomycetaceae bacterium]|nr:hypothetical protein [Planctomycetaceae bacterium]